MTDRRTSSFQERLSYPCSWSGVVCRVFCTISRADSSFQPHSETRNSPELLHGWRGRAIANQAKHALQLSGHCLTRNPLPLPVNLRRQRRLLASTSKGWLGLPKKTSAGSLWPGTGSLWSRLPSFRYSTPVIPSSRQPHRRFRRIAPYQPPTPTYLEPRELPSPFVKTAGRPRSPDTTSSTEGHDVGSGDFQEVGGAAPSPAAQVDELPELRGFDHGKELWQ